MEGLLNISTEEKCSLNFIRRNIIGHDSVVKGPFGFKKMVYCDYVASGKPLKCIEDYIQKYVYPYYANSHTTTSFSAKQTTKFREDARDIIKSCLNCGKDDILIFCGNGATTPVHKLIHAMAIQKNADKTVVVVGPFEHHSNILPWKEAGCIVERIGCNEKGLVDFDALEKQLEHYSKKQHSLIVSMSAASNVTGILTNTKKVSELVHSYGAISIWDYAAGAPYLEIDMNPSKRGYKDAVFISPHKFIGGVGTPGILVAKKALFVNQVPHGCGGGTVNWVTRDKHEYLTDIEEREEGGTPAIIGSIRAGLAFQIKRAVGQDVINEREEDFCKRATQRWLGNENIVILGNTTAKHLPIFSFLILHKQSGLYLHHNYVSTLLNDLYGIQSRGGCACAGPYAQDLLSISAETADRFTMILSPMQNQKPCLIMKPGFCRLNLPYFASEETIEYVLEAVDQVALYGWMLLPLYRYNVANGEWYFWNNKQAEHLRSLQEIFYSGQGMLVRDCSKPIHCEGDVDYSDMLAAAKTIISNAQELSAAVDFSEQSCFELNLSKEDQSLLWFVQPKTAHSFLKSFDVVTFDQLVTCADGTEKSIKLLKKQVRKHAEQGLSWNIGSGDDQTTEPGWNNIFVGSHDHQRQFFFRNQRIFLPKGNKLASKQDYREMAFGNMTLDKQNNDSDCKESTGTKLKSHKKKNKGCVIA